MGKDKAEKKLKKQAKAKPINVKAVNPEIFDGDRIAEGKKSRFARVKVTEKKPREKRNIKLAFKEFPIKFSKEIRRIKWSPKNNLGKKFLIVLCFVAAFALFYFALDLGLFNLLRALKIM